MAKKMTIWFDMDGTIADLYGHENWLKRLRSDDATIFSDLMPMITEKLVESLLATKAYYTRFDIVIDFGIITWTPMECNYKFFLECAKAKSDWMQKFFPTLVNVDTNFYAIPYGTPKQSVLSKDGLNLLIDDNFEVVETFKTKKRRQAFHIVTSEVPTTEIRCNAIRNAVSDFIASNI